MSSGHDHVERVLREQKWSDKPKKTRIELTLFLIFIVLLAFWFLEYEEVLEVMGAALLLYLALKVIEEVKTWFKK